MSVETPILGEGAPGEPGAELIKNTTTQDFMRDVVDESRECRFLSSVTESPSCLEWRCHCALRKHAFA